MLFSVFDTETTGLPKHRDADLRLQPRIIEFAGLITDGKEIIETVEFICNPGIAIETIITEITGLTNEDLKDKPPFKQFIPQVAEFFGKTRGRIAHNLSFDRSMLDFDLKRLGMSLDEINWFTRPNGTKAIEICTVEETFHQTGYRQRLQDLYQKHFGPYVQKHRALDDVILLHKIAQKEGVYEALTSQENE